MYVYKSYSRVPNKRVGPIKSVGGTFFSFMYVGEKTWKREIFLKKNKKCNNLIRDLRVPKYKVNLSSEFFDLKITRIKACFYISRKASFWGC